MDSLSYMVSELELIIKQEQTGSFFPEFIRGCYEVCGVLAISDERTSPFYFSMGCEELVYNPAVLVTLDFHHIVPTTFTITIFSCRLNCPVFHFRGIVDCAIVILNLDHISFLVLLTVEQVPLAVIHEDVITCRVYINDRVALAKSIR